MCYYDVFCIVKTPLSCQSQKITVGLHPLASIMKFHNCDGEIRQSCDRVNIRRHHYNDILNSHGYAIVHFICLESAISIVVICTSICHNWLKPELFVNTSGMFLSDNRIIYCITSNIDYCRCYINHNDDNRL